MSVLTLALRDIREKQSVFVAALIIGVLLLGLPWLPGLHASNPTELRTITAFTAGVGLALGMAILHGATMIASDLSERRFGFYLARPVTTGTLFAGKLLGGGVLVLGTALLVILPVALASGGVRLSELNGLLGGVGTISLVLLLLLLAAHVVSISLRARSPWLLAEFGGLLLGAWLVWQSALRLLAGLRWDLLGAHLVGILLATLLVLGTATWILVAHGRTDLRRGHRLQALVLSAGLVAVGLGALAHATWAVSYRFEDLLFAEIGGVSPDNTWAFVRGRLRDRNVKGAFLLELATGRRFRLAPQPAGYDSDFYFGTFSADGRRAVWAEAELDAFGKSHRVLKWVDLAAKELAVRTSGLPEGIRVDYYGGPKLSPDGRRVTVYEEKRLQILDLETGMPVASIPAQDLMGTGFRDPEHLGLIFQRDNKTSVGTLDLSSGRTTEFEPLAAFRYALWPILWSPMTGRMLLRRSGKELTPEERALHLVDERTGQVLAILPTDARGISSTQPTFDVDGSLWLGRQAATGPVLEHFDPSGKLRLSVDLAPASDLPRPHLRVRFLGRTASGSLQVLLETYDPRHSLLLRVDPATGKWTELAREVFLPISSWFSGDAPRPAPRLFYTREGVVLLGEDGTRQVVLAKTSEWMSWK
jgi:hypothetical protein